MSHEQLSAAVTDLDIGQDPASTFLTDRHRHAIESLSNAYSSERALAVMLSDSHLASSFVIQTFLSGLPEDVAVAHFGKPCCSATEFMGKVIDSVGFQPKDMSLEDLEGIFAMFLSFQKSHGRRTVLCIERTQDNDMWVLDKIRSLVEREADRYSGLFVLVAGQDELKELLHSGPLSVVSEVAGKRIVLPPFTLSETRTYIRQRLATCGKAGIDQLFRYEAVTLIHELCKGIPDDVAALVNDCLADAAAEGISLVTVELVQRAHDKAEQDATGQNADTVNMRGFRPRGPRLVFQITGEDIQEMVLRHGHTLIGRSTLCDVRIDSSTVSRRHALISYTPDSVTLVDLNSTNGTFVDRQQIRRHELQAGETIEVGGTRIEYIFEPNSSDDRTGTLETGTPLIPRA